MANNQNDLEEQYSELPPIPSDIEISQNAVMKPIVEIAPQLGISDDDLEQFGKYKAKIENNVWESVKDRPDGKLILVTAVTPTPRAKEKHVHPSDWHKPLDNSV